jgi:glycosyltransferase involved in cell wall biosynthesis
MIKFIKNLFSFSLNVLKATIHHFTLLLLARPKQQVDGYNVFGYFSKVMGQAEVARAFTNSILKNETNYSIYDFLNVTHKRITPDEELRFKKDYYKPFKYKNNVFFIDLLVLDILKNQNPKLFRNKHNIVAFWWEFESGFEDRIPILNKFDEVYVFSDFIKNVLTEVDNRQFKVTKIKYPFIKNWHIEEDPIIIRERYKLTNKFCFFFNYDYYSSYNRKNPEAILKALYEEFPEDQEVVFVVKTSNNKGYEKEENRFKSLVNEYGLKERVIIINDHLTRNEFMTLLNAMDCYISLHRGEGLGLGILEALALGKKVIATNYGGNTEFMGNSLCYPVPYHLINAGDDYINYRNVKEWAEPDISEAKKYMREVYF